MARYRIVERESNYFGPDGTVKVYVLQRYGWLFGWSYDGIVEGSVNEVKEALTRRERKKKENPNVVIEFTDKDVLL